MDNNRIDIPQQYRPFLFGGLAAVSFLLGLPACFAAIRFLVRGIPGDTTGGVAAGLIGFMLIGASIASARAAWVATVRRNSMPVPLSKHYVWAMVAFATPLGLLAICGSIGFLWEVADLINQEYLQLFPVKYHMSFGDRSTAFMIWANHLPLGVSIGAAGVFLLWFVVRTITTSIAQSTAKKTDGRLNQ